MAEVAGTQPRLCPGSPNLCRHLGSFIIIIIIIITIRKQSQNPVKSQAAWSRQWGSHHSPGGQGWWHQQDQRVRPAPNGCCSRPERPSTRDSPARDAAEPDSSSGFGARCCWPPHPGVQPCFPREVGPRRPILHHERGSWTFLLLPSPGKSRKTQRQEGKTHPWQSSPADRCCSAPYSTEFLFISYFFPQKFNGFWRSPRSSWKTPSALRFIGASSRASRRLNATSLLGDRYWEIVTGSSLLGAPRWWTWGHSACPGSPRLLGYRGGNRGCSLCSPHTQPPPAHLPRPLPSPAEQAAAVSAMQTEQPPWN